MSAWLQKRTKDNEERNQVIVTRRQMNLLQSNLQKLTSCRKEKHIAQLQIQATNTHLGWLIVSLAVI